MKNIIADSLNKHTSLTVNKKDAKIKGYTLIELLLYIGLLSVFIGVLTGLFGMAVDIFLGSQSDSGLARDSNYLINKLSYDISRAQSVTTPANLGDSTNSLSLLINNVSYTYALDTDGNLVYSNNLGSFILNSYAAKITNLNFTRTGNSGGIEASIKTAITFESRVRQSKGTDTSEVNTTYTVRRQQ